VERLNKLNFAPKDLTSRRFAKDSRFTKFEKKRLKAHLCRDLKATVGPGLCHMPAVYAAATLMYPPNLIKRCVRPLCGTGDYCSECSDTMKVLGNSWHLGSAASAIVSALITLRYNKNGQLPGVQFSSPVHHECNDACPARKSAADNFFS
jgi:hypothetical protein